MKESRIIRGVSRKSQAVDGLDKGASSSGEKALVCLFKRSTSQHLIIPTTCQMCAKLKVLSNAV